MCIFVEARDKHTARVCHNYFNVANRKDRSITGERRREFDVFFTFRWADTLQGQGHMWRFSKIGRKCPVKMSCVCYRLVCSCKTVLFLFVCFISRIFIFFYYWKQLLIFFYLKSLNLDSILCMVSRWKAQYDYTNLH